MKNKQKIHSVRAHSYTGFLFTIIPYLFYVWVPLLYTTCRHTPYLSAVIHCVYTIIFRFGHHIIIWCASDIRYCLSMCCCIHTLSWALYGCVSMAAGNRERDCDGDGDDDADDGAFMRHLFCHLNCLSIMDVVVVVSASMRDNDTDPMCISPFQWCWWLLSHARCV